MLGRSKFHTQATPSQVFAMEFSEIHRFAFCSLDQSTVAEVQKFSAQS